MDNLFGMIRRNKIFGQPNEEDNPYKVDFPSTDTNTNIVTAPQDASPMMDDYKKQLGEMPNREDYKPSLKNKFGAALAGFSSGVRGGDAFKTTRGALDEPYEEAEDEWNKRIARTGQLASLESSTNAAKSKNAYNYAKLGEDHENNVSLRNYRNKQGENLDSEIANRGSESYTDHSTGTRNHVDKNGKIIWSAKADLTPSEKNASELGLYTDKGKIGLKNDETLASYRGGVERKTHQDNERFDVTDPTIVGAKKDMETFKNDLSKDDINLRDSLRQMNPTQQNAALAGAIQKTIIDNPAYSKFKDASGNIVGGDDPDYEDFRAKVGGYINSSIGKKATPKGNPLAARPNTPTIDPDAEAKKGLKGKPDGSYAGSDGSTWTVKNGLITKVKNGSN